MSGAKKLIRADCRQKLDRSEIPHTCLFWGQSLRGRRRVKRADVRSLREQERCFEGGKRIEGCPIALRFDPEPTRRSRGGTTARAVGGRPITSGRSASPGRAMPRRYATSCAASARAMSKLSTSNTSRAICFRRLTRRGRLSADADEVTRPGQRRGLRGAAACRAVRTIFPCRRR